MKRICVLLFVLNLTISPALTGCTSNTKDAKKEKDEYHLKVKKVTPYSTKKDVTSNESGINGFKLELSEPIKTDEGRYVTEVIVTNSLIGGGLLFFPAMHPDRVYQIFITGLYTTDGGKHYETNVVTGIR